MAGEVGLELRLKQNLHACVRPLFVSISLSHIYMRRPRPFPPHLPPG